MSISKKFDSLLIDCLLNTPKVYSKTTTTMNKIGATVEIDVRNINTFQKNIPTIRKSVRNSLKQKNLPTGGINFKIEENGLVEIECNSGLSNFKIQRLQD